MAKEWAKLHRNAGRSRRIASLLKTNGKALALYWMMKPWADHFGHYTADPDIISLEVGGLAHLSRKSVLSALSAMESCGLIRRYEVDGKPYLELLDYHNHEEPSWAQVTKPEYPHPEDWLPPESLLQFLRENIDARNVSMARYGLPREYPLDKRIPLNTLEYQPIQAKQSRVEESRVEESREQIMSGKSPDAAKARKPILTKEQQAELEAQAWADIPEGLHDQTKSFLGSVNPSGQMSGGRLVALLLGLKSILDDHGVEGLRHGFEAALAKGAGNLNYVRKAAENNKASPKVGRPAPKAEYFSGVDETWGRRQAN